MQSLIKKKRLSGLTELILLGVGLFFRVINLNRELIGDENTLTYIAQMNFSQLISVLKWREVYPPFTYLLMHYWLKLGNSFFWIRLYFVIFGLGVCILLYLIGKELSGRQFGRLLLLFGVFSPLLIFTSQYVRSSSDSVFWSLLSLVFLIKLFHGKETLLNWLGYVISIVINVYTFYFSVLFVISQVFLVTIFKFRDKKFLWHYCLGLVLAGLVFMFWFPSAASQFKNATSVAFDWSNTGFNIGFLHLGLYVRNMFSVFGFDPYFMVFKGGVLRYFTKPALALMVTLISLFSLFFIYLTFVCLKSFLPRAKDKVFLWMPYILVFVTLIFSWICATLLNVLPNARYLGTLHAVFLIPLAGFIYTFWLRNRKIGIVITFIVLSIFSIRIPFATSSEFEIEKARLFLKRNLSPKDCILSAYSPLKGISIRSFVIEDKDIILNERKSGYLPLNETVWWNIKEKLPTCKSIWFYRLHGHEELFGLNTQIENFLLGQGYRIHKKAVFNNIDVEQYIK